MFGVPQLTPLELKARLDKGDKVQLLDIREPWEIALCSLSPGIVAIPLGDLPHGLDRLDPDGEIVAICHHGVRSAKAVGFLQKNGFKKATNLAGGIDRWATDVDPKMARY
jgi:adenylyltransferase/sulfurtransferase